MGGHGGHWSDVVTAYMLGRGGGGLGGERWE